MNYRIRSKLWKYSSTIDIERFLEKIIETLTLLRFLYLKYCTLQLIKRNKIGYYMNLKWLKTYLNFNIKKSDESIFCFVRPSTKDQNAR